MTSSRETVSCNLCDGTLDEPYLVVQDRLLARAEVSATLVRCRRCGLVYQNPRPTLAAMGEHYPDAYEPYADHMAEAGDLEQRAIEYGIQKRTRFVTRQVDSGRILDVGCATGTFLVGMRTLGRWQVEGVEINPQVAEAARNRFGLQVHTGTLEEAALPPARFDAVTMWDVLEHVHDPTHTLQEIHRILKPGGIVVIRVPNLDSWDVKLFGTNWAGYDAPRHLYVFTRRTLTALLRKTGFRVVDHSCAIGSYMTFAISVRFWLTARGVSEPMQRRIHSILYAPITRLASAPFFMAPNWIGRGPLLVTTARKVERS